MGPVHARLRGDCLRVDRAAQGQAGVGAGPPRRESHQGLPGEAERQQELNRDAQAREDFLLRQGLRQGQRHEKHDQRTRTV